MKIFIVETKLVPKLDSSKRIKIDVWDTPKEMTKDNKEMIKDFVDYKRIKIPYIVVEVPNDMTKELFIKKLTKKE